MERKLITLNVEKDIDGEAFDINIKCFEVKPKKDTIFLQIGKKNGILNFK